MSRWMKHEEKNASKSSTNQDKIATDVRKYFNDWKKCLTTFQVEVLSKSSCKSTYCNYLNLCKYESFVNRVVNLRIVIL